MDRVNKPRGRFEKFENMSLRGCEGKEPRERRGDVRTTVVPVGKELNTKGRPKIFSGDRDQRYYQVHVLRGKNKTHRRDEDLSPSPHLCPPGRVSQAQVQHYTTT